MDKINKEIGLRIAAARKKKGMTATELSQKTGFTSARISHWEQGRRLPNLESVLLLEQHLEVSASYLLCVDRELYKNPNSNSIPLYPLAAALAGPPIAALPLPIALDNPALFAIQLVDNSMAPMFRRDDIVIFHPERPLVDGALVLFKINKTNRIVFRKYALDNADMDKPIHTFTALEPSVEKITTASAESFTILGVYNDTIRLFL
jgi:transcriptional regulator with XRE-family HTH domain